MTFLGTPEGAKNITSQHVTVERVPRGVPLETIIEAYRATGSVWKAGKRVGLAGQTVHERLRAANHPLLNAAWTDEEYAELDEMLENGVTLSKCAEQLGRTYAAVALKASRRGKSNGYTKPRKLPRGVGFDKETTKKRLKDLHTYEGKFTHWCRQNNYPIEQTAQAMQRHFPVEWQEYVASRSDLTVSVCEYCKIEFVPSIGKQRFCTRICASRARTDAQYFGGKRRETVGLAEGICQVCRRKVDQYLSSHHMLGKENDPENLSLIALCRGCHDLVTKLGARPMIADEDKLGALLSLAWIRHHGKQLAEGEPMELEIDVRIEARPYDPETDPTDDDE